MPRGTVDYQKGLIYTIKTGDSLYVGSTTDFRKRKGKHNADLKTKKDRKLYKIITENGYEWEMKPYKIFPCNSKLELEIEEEKIRRELNADLNMNSCCGEDKEKEKEYMKKYRQENKEKIKQYCKNQNNKEKKKEYYQNNKDKILQQKKEYYRKKKEENK